MNYPYLPPVPAPMQTPYQFPITPQGVVGTQLGQLAGGIAGHFLPGPFGGIASQLLPQFGSWLPFQAGPQAMQTPYQFPITPQGVIGSQFGQLAGNIAGHFLPGPFGGIASQLLPQFGSLLPFQAGPQAMQTPYQFPITPQGVIGSQLGQWAGGIAGQFLPGPFGGIANQLLPQLGGLLPFQAGPQAIPTPYHSPFGPQLIPMGGFGLNLPFFNVGVQW